MKKASEKKLSVEQLSLLSEKELVIHAYSKSKVAQLIVLTPKLMSIISAKHLSAFLFQIAINNDSTARLIFSHLDVKSFFPVGVDCKNSKLQKIFCHHQTVEYKIEILFHCNCLYSEALEELCRVLLRDTLPRSENLRNLLITSFVLSYSVSYPTRLQFLQRLLLICEILKSKPLNINKQSFATFHSALLDILPMLQNMPPLWRLPAPLLAKIRTDVDDVTAKNFDKVSSGIIKTMLSDQAVWRKLLNFDYPNSTPGGMTCSFFYKQRRGVDKLQERFNSLRAAAAAHATDQLNSPQAAADHAIAQQAANDLMDKLEPLTRTGDQYCRYLYVKFFIVNFLETVEVDNDFFTETDYCLELLADLIDQNYNVAECTQMQYKIMDTLAGEEDQYTDPASEDRREPTTEEGLDSPELSGANHAQDKIFDSARGKEDVPTDPVTQAPREPTTEEELDSTELNESNHAESENNCAIPENRI